MVESLPSLEDEDVEVDEELDVVLDEEEPVSSVIEIYNMTHIAMYVCTVMSTESITASP